LSSRVHTKGKTQNAAQSGFCRRRAALIRRSLTQIN
jgi:hypothetical protein